MSFKAVKGTRDFYPEIMRVRNYIFDAWRRVSLRNGFEEFDSPIFEYLELFTAKSGQEIASQLFNFTDRGGRSLAIRPEITPSLARMVNAKINSLARPIKWFSMPRLCRAENPQKGRLREFFQWNVDIIGETSELADAECVFVCIDALRELGLSPGDVALRYSSRALLSAVLKALNTAEDRIPAVTAALDKRNKVPPEAFDAMLKEAAGDERIVAGVAKFAAMEEGCLEASKICQELNIGQTPEIAAACQSLASFRAALDRFGIGQWCRYDAGVVRGLAYYTGIVYEVFDAGQSLRAVAGGGRYDNLLEVLGGPKVTATGFGMGDVVLGILLEEKGKLPPLQAQVDCFVIDAEESAFDAVLGTVSRLRQGGVSAEYSYKRQHIGKQLKEANRRGARKALIVKSAQEAGLKDLVTGDQADMSMDEAVADLLRAFGVAG
ncbi:MAG: histidine--tRNA ligase [Planctomycetes bacterium]|nr:histidine--tRNA ligase [Planctomycetota bacterium]